MSHNFLTIHSLTAMPVHNRNRDDHGQPKQLREGGVNRGVLSSQSIKRSARINYERSATDVGFRLGSIRSKSVAALAVTRAGDIAAAAGISFDPDTAIARATKTIVGLTTKEANTAIKKAESARAAHAKKCPAGADAEKYMADYDAAADAKGGPVSAKDTVVYVSAEEIESLALALAFTDDEVATEQMLAARTGSLALAGFGRMLANATNFRVEAGIAVSPAVTTHQINVNIDYFTAVDDLATQGAAHLDQAFYTSGVYYRTATFDKAQLQSNWSGFGGDMSDELLTEFVRNVTLSLPEGKKNGTSAAPLPELLIAEQQRTRTGYQFQNPVKDAGNGYLEPSVDELYAQATRARMFDPRSFGDAVVSGVGAIGRDPRLTGVPVVDMGGFTDFIVDWLRP